MFDAKNATVNNLSNALRDRKIRSIDLIESVIRRIETVNPSLNALVAQRFDRARDEALAADAALDRGESGPLLGIPCTVKEFIAVQDMPHSAGLAARRAVRSDQDAVAVQRFRSAGAIIVGTTNGPEGGLWSETTNPVYGRTNNPWDLKRTPGGSSGGEAALIAVGASPLGLGSDIGGSVRIPAAFCGIAAHKPTGGALPTTGHHPPHPSDYLCIGPMARSAQDLEQAMRVLLPDRTFAGAPAPGDLTVLVPQHAAKLAHPDVARALSSAEQSLRGLGAKVVPFPMPALDKAFWVWAAALGASEGPTYADVLFNDPDRSVWPELLRAIVGRSQHSLPPLVVAASEIVTTRARMFDPEAMLHLLKALEAELQERLDERTVLLLPTMPRPAPKHGGMFLHFTDSGWCGLFNVLKLPATTIPFGQTRGGLPIGMQIVAGTRRDDLALGTAQLVEALGPGWQPPPAFHRSTESLT